MLPSAPGMLKIWEFLYGFIYHTVPQQWKDIYTYLCAIITCTELLSLSLYFWQLLGKCHLKQFPMSSINVSYTLINNARSLKNISMFCSVFSEALLPIRWHEWVLWQIPDCSVCTKASLSRKCLNFSLVPSLQHHALHQKLKKKKSAFIWFLSNWELIYEQR